MGPKPEGKPFAASTKALARELQTCTTSGLVADLGNLQSTHADEFWWRENTGHCVGEQTGEQAGEQGAA